MSNFERHKVAAPNSKHVWLHKQRSCVHRRCTRGKRAATLSTAQDPSAYEQCHHLQLAKAADMPHSSQILHSLHCTERESPVLQRLTCHVGQEAVEQLQDQPMY